MEDSPIATVTEVGALDLDKMLNDGWEIKKTYVAEDESHRKMAKFLLQKSPKSAK